MARPLRILVEGGWYHVTARGNRREALFFNDTDRRRFLGRVAELPERFGLEVHAFVLMSNHYVAVRHGGHRLAEVVPRIAGLKYPAGAQAVRRFGVRLEQDRELKRFVEAMKRLLAKAGVGE